MTADESLYKVVDGEPVLSLAAMALLFGVAPEELAAERERQIAASGDPNAMSIPGAWTRQGIRLRKEVQAALGYEADLKECLDFLAARKTPTTS